jgi:hypothetical protein
VANRVQRWQRRWATPVPQVQPLAEFHPDRRRQGAAERPRTTQRTTDRIGVRCAQERVPAVALPPFPGAAGVRHAAVVDQDQTVRFATHWSSVPRTRAFRHGTVKGSGDRVALVPGGQEWARPQRWYQRHAPMLDPVQELVTLTRNPAAREHAPGSRPWQLPRRFAHWRRHREAGHGPRTGTRHDSRVLHQWAQHPVERGRRAIPMALGRG